MKLYLDSSNNLQTIIKLDDQEFVTEYTSPRDQNVLSAISWALSQTNSQIGDLTEVEVVTGPGSFTGLRVGVVVANTLSMALNIPINNRPPGSIILPEYGQPPSITKPK